MDNIEELFNKLDRKIQEKSEELSDHDAIIKFNITGPNGGVWIANLKPGSSGVLKTDGESDCTITTSDANLIKLVNGELKPEMAILTGKIRLSGNIGIAMKLANFF